ncbi:glycosyltransferase family 1 protein [Microbacterium aoyamense]|uniref:Glycosyltransferase family 1 protein n=1 Tax=Microbacterium aoyamense TaxID=344166 RepID=A0ABN2PN09_9MICO|nr:glycosyltransferase family 1 protein [Microbacterium aoyamense]
MPPTILIDLLSYTGGRGGTETYARQISVRLPRFLPPGSRLVALTGRAGAESVRAFFPGDVVTVSWVGSGRTSWAAGELLAAERVRRRVGADVIWCPANFGPIGRRAPRVTTVHDVIYHSTGRGFVARLTAWLMERTALGSRAAITGSEAARDDILRYIALDPERLTVIPHGTTDPRPPADPAAALREIGIDELDRPLVLSTGNRLPHKNFEGLLRAVARMPADRRPLTVIPGGGPEDPLIGLRKELGLDADVLLPGWVTSAQLEALYGAADLYVCTSLSEGFGLPVVDAMRRGCLMLANDIPVLREVGGDAARYADARDPSILAEAIESALADPMRDERRAEGLAWSSQFTWERSAERTASVLAGAASQGAG